MKIAVNTRFLLPNKLEGIGWYSYEVLRRLVEYFPDDEFLFLFDRPYSDEFIFGKNVTPLSVFPQARHPFLFYWWFEWSLPKVFRKQQPDLFFSPDGFLSLRTKVSTLLVIHDIAWQHFPTQVPFFHRKHYQYFMPRFAKRADHILTVSEYSRQDIIQHLHAAPEKVEVVYAAGNPASKPIDNEQQIETRNKYTNGKPYLLYVGSIHPRKNVPRLLQAFEQFKGQCSSDLQLVLAGRMAWQTGAVGDTINKMRFKDEVHFLGYLPTDELLRITASAFAMVYVSLFEGFGIPIADAMHAAVPVITSNTSSMPEVAGNAALLADPYSVDSICQQMLRLYKEDGLRQKLIDLGLQQAQSFSWDKSAKGVAAVIQKMLNH